MASGDTELMRQAQAGDAAAFWQLAHTHRATVYRIARGIVGSPEDAEDVVQEVFLRAYQALRRFDLARPPIAWLRTITVHCAISVARRRGRTRLLDGATSFPEAASAWESPEDHAIGREAQDRLRRSLGALSPQQRAAITLSAIDGLSVGEIAEAMGCRTPTVKTHLLRARERLAHLMADHLREG